MTRIEVSWDLRVPGLAALSSEPVAAVHGGAADAERAGPRVGQVEPHLLAPFHLRLPDEGIGVRVEQEAVLADWTLWELRDLAAELVNASLHPMLVVVRGGPVDLVEVLHGIAHWPLRLCLVDDVASIADAIAAATADINGGVVAPEPTYSAAFGRAADLVSSGVAFLAPAGELGRRRDPVVARLEAIVGTLAAGRCTDTPFAT